MLSTSKQLELETRREIERNLIALGFSHQDIATALGIDTSSVVNDLKKIGEVKTKFDTTGLTWPQRRDKSFHYAMLEWFSIHDVSDYAKKLDVYQEVARGIVNSLSVYLDMKRINGIVEGVISNIQMMINPTDPPEYVPYRQLLMAIFGERSQKVSKEKFLAEFHFHVTTDSIQLTRDSFPFQLADWALEYYKFTVSMPFDKSVKTVMDEVLSTLPYEPGQEVIRLRFGFLGENPLTQDEIAIRFDVTRERIRQIESKNLRQLRHPERAHRLRAFLESPFEFTRRALEEMSTPPAPVSTISTIVYEGANIGNIDEILVKSVEEMELSVRSYSALKNANIQTIGELIQKTEAEILRCKNFGRKSLNEIKEILEPIGLSFGMKIENGVLNRPVVVPVQEFEE